MLLLSRLRNIILPDYKEILFLVRGITALALCFSAPCFGPLPWDKESLGLTDMPSWSLNPFMLDFASSTWDLRISCPNGAELVSRACVSLFLGSIFLRVD